MRPYLAITFYYRRRQGANQAVAAARLGGTVQMIAKVGSDVFGGQALENLAKEGIDISHVTKMRNCLQVLR